MPGTRLVLLGIAAAVVMLVLIAGTVFQLMRDSFKALREAQEKQEAECDAAPLPPPRPRVSTPRRERSAERYTPRRTGLRWHSPEIAAVLLLALAAGLWLARLAG